ncbi:MAG: cation transporter [Clostridia bacterium]|nr:cation transporter [Clostridia bacterium]
MPRAAASPAPADARRERRAGRRAAGWALVWNLVLTVGKGAAGLAFGSQALVADAAHSLGDAAGSFAVLYGIHVADLPPDRRHRYGHAKAEPVAALAVGVILAAVGLGVVAGAFATLFGERGLGWPPGTGGLSAGQAAPGPPDRVALVAALLALGLKEALYRWNRRLGERLRSPALLAAAADHRSDEWTSLAAAVGIAGARLGLPLADPFAALIVGGLVLLYAVQVLSANVDSLLDLEADSPTRALVREAALAVPGVRRVDRLRTRRSGPFVHVDLEVAVDGSLPLVEADRIAHRVMDAVQALEAVQDVVVHVNPL